ncbi:class I SAM-dependent methyltransferase [Marinobacter orientalis]|uniref:Class I SAM-dependent methyltransferase n=1 Tax=Marinobacter orientalis TaxID=1928859 RepID=A0A7Y0RFE5_9GAMM|nr:class I SAM-dependent methyltransferase [Marinobacter orientalis]NMT65225.1 class I SAM-dependent methyltransferase [Marinobacter orientalis]TGX48006.1 class I SAM-dependent methyltransferase [Marinobacter orientalis]
MSRHSEEINSGKRFSFGKNWQNFIKEINEKNISEAEKSLKVMLNLETLSGKSFLDAGSGSGLFSLAARRLGAKVHSFDYDPHSVACTNELKCRYFPGDDKWRIEEASVLDVNYLLNLGEFDVVYSWGVLHHTGAMWRALENIEPLVKINGKLFIAIYNDQGSWSRRWRILKIIYNRLPGPFKPVYAGLIMAPREMKFFMLHMLKGRPHTYINNIINYSQTSFRGMSMWHDLVDWIGGYPFEVAKPEAIFSFYHGKGFELERLKTNAGSLGCNEYVFSKRGIR